MFPLAILAVFLAAAATPVGIAAIVTVREEPAVSVSVSGRGERADVWGGQHPDCVAAAPMPRFRADTMRTEIEIGGKAAEKLRSNRPRAGAAARGQEYTLRVYPRPICGDRR